MVENWLELVKKPIEVQTHLAPQNDCLNLSFDKYLKVVVKKITRNSGKTAITEGHSVLEWILKKIITQVNDYYRVKGDTLKFQNCHELKSSTLGYPRSLRSNDLKPKITKILNENL